MLNLSHVYFEVLKEKIVEDFNLDLRQGEVKTLFGKSGCGKTTILRLVCALEKASKGKISNQFKKTAILFQENRLLDNLDAMQNIAIFMPKPDPQKIIQMATKIGITESDLNKYPTQLSGGMAKRIAFIRLMLSDADLMLLDEPFTGLDKDLRNILVAMLTEKIEQENLACLMVTHDRFEACRLSHEILLLSEKGMHINQVIQLNTPLQQRNEAYEEKIVQEQFKGIKYYG